MNTKTKIIIVSVITLIVTALVILAWMAIITLRPISDPLSPNTSGDLLDGVSKWKTYRNEEHGFEVKYPGEWDISEDKADSSFILELSTEYAPNSKSPKFKALHVARIKVKENTNNLSINDLVKQEESAPTFSIYGLKKYSQLDGQSSFEGRVDNWGMGSLYQVFSIKNGNVYEISFSYFYDESLEFFRKILSTLKFIEPIDTSGWQTYRNYEYGFEVKYPGNFMINDSTGEGIPKTDVLVYLVKGEKDNPPNTRFVIMKDYNRLSSSIDIEKAFDRYFNARFSELATQREKLNGYNVVTGLYTDSLGNSYRGVVIADSKSSVGFQSNYPIEDEKLLNQILSTFKFIN